jgi:hypothetical protein
MREMRGMREMGKKIQTKLSPLLPVPCSLLLNIS